MTLPKLVRSAKEIAGISKRAHDQGHSVVLVPTMGCLHEGHLSLIRVAHDHGKRVIVSIFVNPTQFGPKEDFAAYPRTLERDLDALAPLGVEAVFAPEATTIYPPNFDTYVVPGNIASGLCGASRPTHFRGVATVVLILFGLTGCDAAVFGEKDYQQLQVIRRMTHDLRLDVEVIGAPTVREPDGLAMSSRNAYLSPEERVEARLVPQALEAVAQALASGERDTKEILTTGRGVLKTGQHTRVDYLEIVDAETLEPTPRIEAPSVCAVAAFVGTTRLIDNRRLLP